MLDGIPTLIVVISVASAVGSIGAGLMAVWHGCQLERAARDSEPRQGPGR